MHTRTRPDFPRAALQAALLLAVLAPVTLAQASGDELALTEIVPVNGWELSGGTATDGAGDGMAGMFDMPGRDAPAGVMGAMVHDEGEWMFALHVMRMHMDGVRDGYQSVSDGELFGAGYAMAPQKMDSTTTMFEAMYGLTDDVTVMASVPYVANSMDMLMDDGTRFTMNARGLGDVQLGSLVRLWHEQGQELHVNAGLSVPTGAVNIRDDMPGFPGGKVDYAMQLGSGTWDLLPGLTWVARDGDWSWGAQWIETVRLGENSEDYTFGNRRDVSVWGVHHWSEAFGTSLRLAGHAWGNIDGADPDLDPMMSPTQDPNAQGGRRVDALVGASWQPQDAPLRNHRLVLEVGAPIWEKLDGPQLGTDWITTLGWQVWF